MAEINNYWYYFKPVWCDAEGLAASLIRSGISLGEDGRMFTNWQKMDNGTWYYFGTDGRVRTGWQKVTAPGIISTKMENC